MHIKKFDDEIFFCQTYRVFNLVRWVSGKSYLLPGFILTSAGKTYFTHPYLICRADKKIGEIYLYQSFHRSYLIVCIHNVDTLNICMKKFDAIEICFDKMTAF